MYKFKVLFINRNYSGRAMNYPQFWTVTVQVDVKNLKNIGL